MSVPAKLSDLDLDPRQREVVRYYTDPLLHTYGNKKQSLEAAGYSGGSYQVFDHPLVAQAISIVESERVEAGAEVQEYLDLFGRDASKELVKQLSIGRDLSVIDPNSVVDLDGKGEFEFSESEGDRAKAINDHNRNALAAAKERRQALALLLAYVAGTPEQRIKHTHEKEYPQGPLDEWDDGDIEALGEELRKEREKRKAGTPAEAEIPAEVEVIDD